MIKSDKTFVIKRSNLQRLFDAVIACGYTPVGPTVREGVIVYDELRSVQDLPEGWAEDQKAGSYRLKRRDDAALFGFNNGPHSWKKYLFPPKSKLWKAVETGGGGFTVEEPQDTTKPFAFIGARSCDLHAIQVQDRVFMNEQHPDLLYTDRRRKALVIAVNCGQAAKTCFCASMNTGPRAETGYDLALTEILDHDGHYFVAEAGSQEGLSLLADIPHTEVSSDSISAAGCISAQ